MVVIFLSPSHIQRLMTTGRRATIDSVIRSRTPDIEVIFLTLI